MSNTEANTHSSSDGTGVDRSDRGDTAGSGGGTAWSVAISAETEMIMGSVISKKEEFSKDVSQQECAILDLDLRQRRYARVAVN